MNPQLVIDCGGAAIAAQLVTADGQVVPCSEEILHVARRHVSSEIVFDPRPSADPDFVWEDALDALATATSRNFFARAKRVGLRRVWDTQATADTLLLASPLAVLSSAAAIADSETGAVVPRVCFALLDALLEPTFAFVAARRIPFDSVEPFVVVPVSAGRVARLVIEKIFRRRGFRAITFVRREIAAAMALIDEPPESCVVVEASGDDLHVRRVTIGAAIDERSFQTTASATVRSFGWMHWSARVAAALRTTPSSSFRRALASLLTGSPDSTEPRLTHGALQQVLDDAWIAAERDDVVRRLREPLAAIGAAGHTVIFAGEMFALDAVRQAFGGSAALNAPVLDHGVRGVALAMRWLRGGRSRRLHIAPSGTLRVDVGRGDTIELLPPDGMPQPGDACAFDARFRVCGATAEPFLLRFMWGADRVPSGNAAVCAVPVATDENDSELRLRVFLRRSRSGGSVAGVIDAHRSGVAVRRMRFVEQLEVRR